MAIQQFDPKEPALKKHFRKLFGPQHVDQQIRSAIHACWMALPPKKQNVGEVERQIRRIVERALKNLREDAANFELDGK